MKQIFIKGIDKAKNNIWLRIFKHFLEHNFRVKSIPVTVIYF